MIRPSIPFWIEKTATKKENISSRSAAWPGYPRVSCDKNTELFEEMILVFYFWIVIGADPVHLVHRQLQVNFCALNDRTNLPLDLLAIDQTAYMWQATE
jgi:hypothetical protein